MQTRKLETDVAIIGGGLAGIICALELLDHGCKVMIFDRDKEENFGGLARESFGGMFFVNSPLQKRMGIRDSVDLARSDWYNFAAFDAQDIWPKQWADHFIEQCIDEVYLYLREKGIRFFPVIHWVERGWYQPGNSVPRFHMVWGTGFELIRILEQRLKSHPKSNNLSVFFQHKVDGFIATAGEVSGVKGVNERDEQAFEVSAGNVVIAAGGIGGDIDRIKKIWPRNMGVAPQKILNGSHRYALGDLHDLAKNLNANVTNLEKMWNYGAGIHHPKPNKVDHGLSLVPPKSALWLDYRGRRIGPEPLISGYDTRFLVKRICEQKAQYSWQVMNKAIAVKEIAVSGAEYNDSIRKKQWIRFLLDVYFGKKKMVNQLIDDCVDVVVGNSIDELAEKMNALNGDDKVDVELLRNSLSQYDKQFERGKQFYNDEQLRRLVHLKQYRGDRARIARFRPITDKRSMPLLAIREFILSRKSLGGIQTDLKCRVLTVPVDGSQTTINRLYAIGEAAGFGGGGIHGMRSLEGTFLASCVFTGRIAAKTITE